MMGALGAKEGVGVGKRHHVASVAGDKHDEALFAQQLWRHLRR